MLAAEDFMEAVAAHVDARGVQFEMNYALAKAEKILTEINAGKLAPEVAYPQLQAIVAHLASLKIASKHIDELSALVSRLGG